MPSLHSLQRAFANCLVNSDDNAVERHIVQDGFTGRERLEIYRNSCRGALAGSLRLTYPAVNRLVGNEFFDETARRFIAAYWPRSADLNEYGADFVDFLESFAPVRTLPYLADVARFEWALSVAAHADDAAPLDPSTLAALDPACHAGLRFTLHPSTQLLSLRYPADHIADAVLAADEAAMREINLADGPVRLVVYRRPDGVQSRCVEPLEFELLRALLDGVEWSRVAEKAGTRASQFLAQQLIEGRISGFRTAEVVA